MSNDIMAFPMAVPSPWEMMQEGMGLRDWFAGKALHGLLASRDLPVGCTDAFAANRAYGLAQAMLDARQKYEEADNAAD